MMKKLTCQVKCRLECPRRVSLKFVERARNQYIKYANVALQRKFIASLIEPIGPSSSNVSSNSTSSSTSSKSSTSNSGGDLDSVTPLELHGRKTVSYTHLTLPTSDLV